MKTGLGIHRTIRKLNAFINLYRFFWRKAFLGFDLANQFIQRVDKISLILILKKNGATIGQDCDIETGLIFHNCRNYNNLIIGDNCHIGKNCFFDLRDKVIIGNNVVISMQCSFITHIDMNKSTLKKLYPANQLPINIYGNCYFGAGVRVLMGVIVNKGVFVTANSLVIKSIDAGIMVGGIPATHIKFINNEESSVI